MITWIWIEGEKALEEYCECRFHDRPHFIETSGRVGFNVHISMIYKHRDDLGRYVDMYFLYMDAPNDRCINLAGDGQLSDLQRMTYEEIKADRTAILRP